MQTIHSILFLLCSWIVFAAALFKIREIPKVVIWYVAVYLSYLISTLINQGDIYKWVDILIYSFPPLLLAILSKEYKKIYIRIGTVIFLLAEVLNLLFMFFPVMFSLISEWDEQYFMGYHTFIGWGLTLGAYFSLIDFQLNEKKYISVSCLALYFVNIFLAYTGGAKIGAMIVALYIIFPFVKTAFKKWDFIVFLFAIIILFGLLMWCFEPFVNFQPVKYLIEGILHRDTTLSGRLYVWKGALEVVMQKPFVGHGIQTSSQIFYEASKWNQAYVHAHNAFLQTWYEGGILTLITALLMIIFSTRKLGSTSVSAITKLILFSFLIMMQNDLDVYYTWYAVALICQIGNTFKDA